MIEGLIESDPVRACEVAKKKIATIPTDGLRRSLSPSQGLPRVDPPPK